MSSKRARGAPWELEPKRLVAGMQKRVERATEIRAELAFSAIPALLGLYSTKCESLCESAGRALDRQQRVEFRALLAEALQTGFELSAHAKVVVQFTTDPPPRTSLSYQIGVRTRDIADVYATWLRGPGESHFGAHPDAKVMSVARSLSFAAGSRVLDIGAGTGRNALPLARLGLSVDAAEITPAFAAELRTAAEAGALAIDVHECDAFEPGLALPPASYALVVASEVVSSHTRDAADLRGFFEFAADKLVPSGMLVFNLFLARAGYVPDELARQLSPAVLSTVFSRADVEQALRGLPLEPVSDESCVAYEREHLPAEVWPPTSWFEAWASGRNLFDIAAQPPCELRWLTFRRNG